MARWGPPMPLLPASGLRRPGGGPQMPRCLRLPAMARWGPPDAPLPASGLHRPGGGPQMPRCLRVPAMARWGPPDAPRRGERGGELRRKEIVSVLRSVSVAKPPTPANAYKKLATCKGEVLRPEETVRKTLQGDYESTLCRQAGKGQAHQLLHLGRGRRGVGPQTQKALQSTPKLALLWQQQPLDSRRNCPEAATWRTRSRAADCTWARVG